MVQAGGTISCCSLVFSIQATNVAHTKSLILHYLDIKLSNEQEKILWVMLIVVMHDACYSFYSLQRGA